MPDAARTGDVVTAIDGAAAWVLIDRPEAHNALSPEVIAGISAAINAAADASCSVLVIRGSGGTLSAGADLKYLRAIRHDPDAIRAYITSVGDTFGRLASAPFVSVCVVERYAVAGGCELLLACDLAVVSEDAQIGDRHLEYGLLPGAGGSARLPRVVAPAVARRLLLTGEMIDGATAARIGLASHVAAADRIDATVGSLVGRLLRHSPSALARMKRLYQNAVATDLVSGMESEREMLIRHLTEDPAAAEGLDAFAEHRPPDFSRLRPAPSGSAPPGAGRAGPASAGTAT